MSALAGNEGGESVPCREGGVGRTDLLARLREENKRLTALNSALVGTHNFYLIESVKWEDYAKKLERDKSAAMLTPSSLVCCKCGRSWNWIKRDGECGRTDYDDPCPTLPSANPTPTPSVSTDPATAGNVTDTSAITRPPETGE